jgi:hypothetical protein
MTFGVGMALLKEAVLGGRGNASHTPRPISSAWNPNILHCMVAELRYE